MLTNIDRHVRSVLENAAESISLDDLLLLIDEFVLECSSSEKPEVVIAQFEETLQAVVHDVIDYSDSRQIEVMLSILHHLLPILPATSAMSWFHLVHRPALREPKLRTTYLNYAKTFIIKTVQKGEDMYSHRIEKYVEQVWYLRRRILDLYLLDAFNEGSEGDILERAELGEEEKEKKSFWKANLEDILIRYGQEKPEGLFDDIVPQFAAPSVRLQLLTLLNLLSLSPSFSVAAPILSKHPLLECIINSILLDNSSTLCTAAITFLTKALPYFAAYSREDLHNMLPRLLAALARVLCWKERYPIIPEAGDEAPDPELERELAEITHRTLNMRSDLNWNRLEMSFTATASLPPDALPFFTTVFYLYPSNVLKFLRGPIEYLAIYNVETPYVESWKDVFDEDEIRRKSENLLRSHICHPLLIWKDASTELSTPEFWSKYDISRIASETMMLDIRNLAAGLRERFGFTGGFESSFEREQDAQDIPLDDADNLAHGTAESDTSTAPRFLSPLDLSTGKAIVSLSEMINVSNALKANIDVDFIKPEVQWMSILSSRSPSPSKLHRGIAAGEETELAETAVAQAIASLQREVLLLRNELNFELWIQRENVKHIGRLYQDRILMATAEAERQGLYNKLRKYRRQVIALEDELREHKQQASSAKNKYADWNTELQKKLKELREEKKGWMSEAAILRSAEKEAKALFVAQGKLLAEASEHVSQLQTQKKENQHKIDRLLDYERQIEQHIKIQKLWDKDYAQFNARADEVVALRNEVQQMNLRLQSYENTQATLEDGARAYRRQIQALEAKLSIANKKSESPKSFREENLREFVAEKAGLMNANKKLTEENGELNEEIEELRAMVEVLKTQLTGKKGLISDSPRSVPTFS